MRDLKETILGDPLISRVFRTAEETFLVGGYLRDLLRGVRSKDIDFVVKCDPGDMVSRIFPEREGSIIAFRETLLVRVVLGDTVIDFSELKGDIESDLCRRDFTANAIGWSMQQGLVDPLGGIGDIRLGILRGISEKNFLEDPLRLLRAYRFAGELGWKIDRKTREMIGKFKDYIKQSAAERTTLEVFKLLNSDNYLRALKQAFKDGLLNEIISLDAKQLQANLKVLSRLNSFLKKIPEGLRVHRDGTFSQGLSFLGLLRAEQLFYRADLEGSKLSLSRAIRKRLEGTSALLNTYEENRDIDDSRIFDLFTAAGDAVTDFALLARSRRILKKAELFIRIPSVLPAEKVMEISGLGPGPELGRVLHGMRKLQFLGKIRHERDARKWLAQAGGPYIPGTQNKCTGCTGLVF
jgi:tRNA nucleotidyltransferase (CCA-adding enzyme)